MYRYICVVVLTGGKSVRMGFCKSFFLLDGISFLDRALYFYFDIGFIYIFIGGDIKSYSCILDESKSLGPVSSFFSVILNKQFFFSKFIFISIDIPFLNIKSIFRCVFFSGYSLSSCYYNTSLFPLLLVFSKNVYFFLKYLFGVSNNRFYSISRLMYFFLKKEFVFLSFDKKNIVNINRRVDIFLDK